MMAICSHRRYAATELARHCRLQKRQLRLDLLCGTPQYLDIKRRILHVKSRTENVHIEETGILLVDPPQETSLTGPNVDCSIHYSHHRQVRPGALQGFRHDQLLTSGHERDADIACLSHLPRPSASGINNNRCLNRTFGGLDTSDLFTFDDDFSHVGLRHQDGAFGLRSACESDGNLRGIEISI